jgi:hypothetical protein
VVEPLHQARPEDQVVLQARAVQLGMEKDLVLVCHGVKDLYRYCTQKRYLAAAELQQ